MPEVVCPWTGDEIKASANTAIFQLLKTGLRAQVLRVGCIGGDPLQEPLVTLVLAGDLKSDHEVSPEGYHAKLAGLAEESKACAHSNQPKPSSKVGVVLQ